MKKQVKNSISIKNFLKLGGKRRDNRLLLINLRKITQKSEELHLLEKYYSLLVNTDYLRDEVYEFLINSKTYDEVVSDYNVHPNYLRNVIYKEVRDLFEDLTEDPFALILYKDLEKDEEMKKLRVDILIDRIDEITKNVNIRKTRDLTDYLILDLEKYSTECTDIDKVDIDLLNDSIRRLQYLSKPYLQTLFKRIDKDIVGYILYLLSTSERKLSERDITKKKEICDLWFLPKG